MSGAAPFPFPLVDVEGDARGRGHARGARSTSREHGRCMDGVVSLRWSGREREFIDRLSDRGEIVAELITDDPALQALVREQPCCSGRR